MKCIVVSACAGEEGAGRSQVRRAGIFLTDERPVLPIIAVAAAGPTTSDERHRSLAAVLSRVSDMNQTRQFNTRDSVGASFDAYTVSLREPEPVR